MQPKERGWIVAIGVAIALAGCHPNRGDETVACSPGETIWVGCNDACSLGSCWGNPAILVCDGDLSTESCNDDRAIAANDDAAWPCSSTCPLARTVCPASGHVTVTVQRGRGDFACDWGIAQRPFLDGDQVPADASEPGDATIDDASTDAPVDDGSLPGDGAPAEDGG